jgi:4-hydroxy-3-polyprenylbenzoate decarboxylase
MVELGKGRIKPEIVDTASCKEVILTGDDVHLTRIALSLHHDRDGHAYTNDNLVVTKHPDTGVYDWGIYRSMFRTKNEKMFDMTCTSHRARLNAQPAQAKGQNLDLAIVLGGPLVDKVAALKGVPPSSCSAKRSTFSSPPTPMASSPARTATGSRRTSGPC